MDKNGFSLTSPEFAHEGIYPAGRTCDSENSSPELSWTQVPEGTRSLTLILEDPDAPHGTFTHWVLFDIPPAETTLAPNEITIGIPGRNDFNSDAYGGPCPPANHGQHRYFFYLYALDIPSLNLERGAPREDVEEAMKGHILGRAELMARYQRGDNS
jgi:Raf kinase inhibitor-like YbhB/YbcL family protein